MLLMFNILEVSPQVVASQMIRVLAELELGLTKNWTHDVSVFPAQLYLTEVARAKRIIESSHHSRRQGCGSSPEVLQFYLKRDEVACSLLLEVHFVFAIPGKRVRIKAVVLCVTLLILHYVTSKSQVAVIVPSLYLVTHASH